MSKCIFVVDNECNALELMRYNLKKTGYMVETFKFGEEFLERVEQRVPDLILLDLMLPDISGIDVCLKLKKDCRFSEIPVIITSVVNADHDVGLDECEEDKVFYHQKPFNLPKLASKINQLLASHED